MDSNAFRTYLASREHDQESIARMVDIASLACASTRAIDRSDLPFTRQMDLLRRPIASVLSSVNGDEPAITALLAYAKFAGDQPWYAVVLELVDGIEVMPRLHQLLSDRFGADRADRIFAGVPEPLPGSQPETLLEIARSVIERLEHSLPHETIHRLLFEVRHALPNTFRADERDHFVNAKQDIDVYLDASRKRLLEQLAVCRDESRLFYNQPVSPEAYDYIASHDEICGYVREGDRLYKTKIPYMLDAFLEADETWRPFFACHCPWARESLRPTSSESHPVSTSLCACSAGFVAQPLEQAFGGSLDVEVLETALQGSDRCRFAIRLPASLVSD